MDSWTAAPPRDLDPHARRALRHLVEERYGVARVDDLAAAGVTARQLDHQLAMGRWRQVCETVVVLHNGPLTEEQQLSAAVLAGGEVCALAGRTAAAVGGLTGWPSETVQILVPRGAKVPELREVPVYVHESRRFSAEDIQPGRWPARTTMERSLIDAAVWSRRPRAACGILAAGVQQRLTVASRLLDELDNAGKVRHRRMLRSVLHDIAGGAQALSEIDFGRLCRRHHLPLPIRQAVRKGPDGRRRYVDATFIAKDGRLVRVEVDGAAHLLVATYWDDMQRDNELVIAGQDKLRFPSVALHLNEAVVVDQLARALGLSDPGNTRAA